MCLAAPRQQAPTRFSPWVISRDTACLVAFATAAFGAEEIGRVLRADGSVGHAEFRVGESVVLAFDALPHWPETPAFLRLYVAAGEAVFGRAVAAGAAVVTALTELARGDRVGRPRDPLGNLWWIQQRVADFSPEEVAQRMAEPRFAEAMRYVEGAAIFPGAGERGKQGRSRAAAPPRRVTRRGPAGPVG